MRFVGGFIAGRAMGLGSAYARSRRGSRRNLPRAQLPSSVPRAKHDSTIIPEINVAVSLPVDRRALAPSARQRESE
jgi:hypothetical protein